MEESGSSCFPGDSHWARLIPLDTPHLPVHLCAFTGSPRVRPPKEKNRHQQSPALPPQARHGAVGGCGRSQGLPLVSSCPRESPGRPRALGGPGSRSLSRLPPPSKQVSARLPPARSAARSSVPDGRLRINLLPGPGPSRRWASPGPVSAARAAPRAPQRHPGVRPAPAPLALPGAPRRPWVRTPLPWPPLPPVGWELSGQQGCPEGCPEGCPRAAGTDRGERE